MSHKTELTDGPTVLDVIVAVANRRYGRFNANIKSAATPQQLVDELTSAIDQLPAKGEGGLTRKVWAVHIQDHIDCVRRFYHLST